MEILEENVKEICYHIIWTFGITDAMMLHGDETSVIILVP